MIQNSHDSKQGPARPDKDCRAGKRRSSGRPRRHAPPLQAAQGNLGLWGASLPHKADVFASLTQWHRCNRRREAYSGREWVLVNVDKDDTNFTGQI